VLVRYVVVVLKITVLGLGFAAGGWVEEDIPM